LLCRLSLAWPTYNLHHFTGPRRTAELKATIPDASKILLRNVYSWFAHVERGMYALTQHGVAAPSRCPQAHHRGEPGCDCAVPILHDAGQSRSKRSRMNKRSTPSSEEPRTEPQIIPPGRADGRQGASASVDVRGTHRIYVARLGPFGSILLALSVAVLAAVILFMLLGAALILVPVVVLLVAGTIIAGLLRR